MPAPRSICCTASQCRPARSAAAALGVPVVVIPTAPALAMLAATRAGIASEIVVGAVEEEPNAGSGEVAGFSSQGLAFDGGVKPNLVAPGVALADERAGRGADGSALYGTVNGTSGPVATVAAGSGAAHPDAAGARRPGRGEPAHGVRRSRRVCDGERQR